ncbi:pre-mRNA 3'-end-processing factor FIP1-like isoform X2 [Littorina saxatilis]|uniref:pre-mRNA 3'-end-processing factor FIP1-like isoform X2 n=1 Tax=Littorina saxatilis TaxID=31220 RepID=UPI0038B5EA5F
MAAPEAEKAPTEEAAADDDDAWLYGDEGKGKEDGDAGQDKPPSKGVPAVQNGVVVKKEDREEGEMSGEEGESQEKDDDDDSDEDNVQVTIGDIKAWSVNEQPRNLFKSGSNYQKPAAATGTKPAGTAKGIDIDAQGTINSVPVYEFDLNSIEAEEKPWRKPGADITDYFNYGFTEETWQQYCDKQRRLRAFNEGVTKTVTPIVLDSHSITTTREPTIIPMARSRPQVISQPQVGTINVIGGTANNSRRPDEGDPIPVAGVVAPPPPQMGRKFLPVSGMPPTSIPPPHLPPLDYSIPPPGMPPPHGMPPPGMGVPPPGFPSIPDPFDHFGYALGCDVMYSTRNFSAFYAVHQPDRSMPPPGFDDRPPFSYGPSHPTFPGNNFNEPPRSSNAQQWETGSSVSEQDSRDRDREWDRERERREGSRRDRERERSPHRMEEEYARDTKYRGQERERVERDRIRERDRDRDRERDRKRERDRGRRSRSTESTRDRDTESSRRERDEEKHRSRRSDSRRHKGDDSDTESRASSSKHKKSRRRRDKDDDSSEWPAGDATPTKAE